MAATTIRTPDVELRDCRLHFLHHSIASLQRELLRNGLDYVPVRDLSC